MDDDIEEDDESPEAKDHLVAELYKHMEDRGSPINKTPSIDGRDLDLGRLFRMVMKLGGHNRVSNNNLWRKVAQKLGFDTAWCINQVRVHYKRYLQSFEELYRTLGVTMVNHPSRSSMGASSSTPVGGRVQIRGKHRSGTTGAKDSANSDADSEKPGEETAEILKASTRADHDKKKAAEESKVTESSDKKKGKVVSTPAAKDKKPSKSEAAPEAAPPTVTPSVPPSVGPSATPPSKKGGRPSAGGDDVKMTTRPRRDSTSSLAAAMQVKAQKDTIGDGNIIRKANPVVRMDRDQNAENELRKIQAARSPKANKSSEEAALSTPTTSAPPPPTTPSVASAASPPSNSTVANGGKSGNGSDTSAAGDSDRSRTKKKPGKKSGKAEDEEATPASVAPAPVGDAEPETEKQHLAPHVDVDVGDRIKVFYKQNTIYEAKVIRSQQRPGEKWPRFLVHYQGWNARYDEWIKRFRIAENLSWSKDRVKQPKPPEGAVDSPVAEISSAQAPQQQPQSAQQQPQLQRESPRTTRKDLIRKERSEKVRNLNSLLL
jgi:Ras-related protein Rab-1A